MTVFSQRTTFTLVKSMVLGAVLLGAASVAQAQNQLGVNGNSVTISNAGGGFSQAVPISTGGVVTTVSNVPTSGTLDVPTFVFTMNTNTVTDGAYTFSVGFIIDDNATSRRLEINLPLVNMTFSGGGTTLVGSAGGANTRTIGRSADGSVTAAATVAVPGTVNFTGTSLKFDADDVLAAISTGATPLNDIINTIDTLGSTYTYTIILHQLTGPATLNFGSDPAAFTAYPAYAADFILNTNELNGVYAAGLTARKITGQLSFGTASTGGGGGGGSTTTPEGQTAAVTTATTNLANTVNGGVVNEETVTAITSLASDSATAASNVQAGLIAGTVSVATGVELLSSLSSQYEIVRAAYNINRSSALSDSVTSLASSIYAVANGLRKASASVSASQLAQLQTLADNLTTVISRFLAILVAEFSSSPISSGIAAQAITQSTAIADFGSIVNNTELAVSELVAIPNFQFTSNLYTNLQSVSQEASEGVLAPLATQLGLTATYTNDTEAKALLAANTTLLNRLIDIAGVNVGSFTNVNETTTNAAVVAAGLSGSSVSALTTDILKFVKADDLQINGNTVSTTLATALGADTLTVDSITGAINYTNGGSSSVTFLKAVMPAPGIVPSGTYTLSDGSTLINDGTLLYILVSGSNNITDFAGAIQSAGSGQFTTSISDTGVIKLTETASGVVFSSTISTSGLTTATATSTTTFESPSVTDPADSAYRFVVQYDDGTRQEILPAISDAAFFTSVGNAGFQVKADRRTGIVTIGGFSFRPDFFQMPLTTDDAIYLTTNADSSGVAYRAVDANGDGVTDYQVISATGVQTVYTLP